MARSPLLFLLLSSLLGVISAFELNGKIQWNDILPGFEALHPSKVILDNGNLQGGIMRDGSFVIPDVPAGTYILSVVSPDHTFDQASEPEVRPYVVGTPLNPASTVLLSHPITLIPRHKHLYFVPPESFNLVAMFSNPMMLMMVFGGIMMLAMPYLMNNMDPETMSEFKEQHAKVAGMQSAMASGNIKSGISALLGNEESSDTGPAQSSKVSSSVKNRGNNKNKKR